MKRLAPIALIAAASLAARTPADMVNPLAGTLSTFEFSAGNVYPAIARPWGMNFWTPQTGTMGDGWQYRYDAHRLVGLKQTHQPSPWINDYGQFSVMPVTGSPLYKEADRASWFSHKAEEATPYSYSVYLADHDVTAELTPTEHAAAMRFTYPEGMSYLVIDAFDRGSSVEVSADGRTITGRSTRNSGGVPEGFANYFTVTLDRPAEYVATFSRPTEADTLSLEEGRRKADGFHTGAVVGFRTRRGEQVRADVASSFISPDQAAVNQREVSGKPFDALKSEGRNAWNDVLGRISIADPETEAKRVFYTSLYRSLLFPRMLSEVTAKGDTVHYSPYDGKVHPGPMYTDTGVWDTFRALFPLLNLLYPERSREMQEGFLNAYRESGFLPEWCSPGHRDCMVGNNSASVLADAWLKGVCVTDTATLWEAVTHGAHAVHPTVRSTGRIGWEMYDSLGYVPSDRGINESAARSLEYAYDDWCIYRLGKALGRPDSETEPYRRAALNYQKLFRPDYKLMSGRNADGSWPEPFSPLKWGGDFTEGNAWHYTWSVFHDPAGLATLMGGADKMAAMLDSVFTVPPHFDCSYYGFPIHEIREMQVMNMGQYAHGNQPIQHMLYLYDWTPEPWKAQPLLRRVMRTMYADAPDAYCGDEDNGQTSAWYVFSALGFYPVCPGSGQYAIGSPLFEDVTLTLPAGRTMHITAPGNTEQTPYIRDLRLNGRPHPYNYLNHNDLTAGGTLTFKMGDQPDTVRCTGPYSRPYSLSTDEK